MFWTEDVAAKCEGPQIINDSKTPSGRVHVGALRGVLIHDAIFKTLLGKGIEAKYLYGVDDFDPVDEIPKGEDEHFGKYIGWPLCNTPAPCGAEGDMADHYMREFFAVFEELGVKVDRYRMRDVYRAGEFNGLQQHAGRRCWNCSSRAISTPARLAGLRRWSPTRIRFSTPVSGAIKATHLAREVQSGDNEFHFRLTF